MSACTGACLKAWPAFTASSIVVPSAMNASDFGTITRDDGTMQVTFKGYPLYYWVKDKKRGDVTGAGRRQGLVRGGPGKVRIRARCRTTFVGMKASPAALAVL